MPLIAVGSIVLLPPPFYEISEDLMMILDSYIPSLMVEVASVGEMLHWVWNAFLTLLSVMGIIIGCVIGLIIIYHIFKGFTKIIVAIYRGVTDICKGLCGFDYRVISTNKKKIEIDWGMLFGYFLLLLIACIAYIAITDKSNNRKEWEQAMPVSLDEWQNKTNKRLRLYPLIIKSKPLPKSNLPYKSIRYNSNR